MSRKTPLPYWGNTHLAQLFGTSNVMIGLYLNGIAYPTLQMMQKFQIVLGWPVREQVDLIPYYWEWPDQGMHRSTPQGDPVDMRYALMLNRIIREWEAANPRTQQIQDIRQHPKLPHKRVAPKQKKGVTKITPD